MRALVTGCAGFIGSTLSERLVAGGHDVIGVDCFTDYYARTTKEANLEQLRDFTRFRLHEIDLTTADLAHIVDGVDVIYHQAAQPGVRASWGDSFGSYVRNNIVATQRLLEAVKGRSLRKFVYASSSSVYGDAETLPTTEAVVPQPISPYGVTKLAAEQLVYSYWRSDGIPTVSLRYFTVFGPRQRPDMAFHKFIRAVLEERPISIFGDGQQTRDFTFIGDAVAANLAAGECPAAGVALNIGGGSRVSVNEVVALIGDLLGRQPHVIRTGHQRGDVRHTAAGTERAAELLGYRPRVDLRAGLAAEIDWMVSGLREECAA